MTESTRILLKILQITSALQWFCAIFNPEIQAFCNQPTSSRLSFLFFLPFWEPPTAATLVSYHLLHPAYLSFGSGLAPQLPWMPTLLRLSSLDSPSKPSSSPLVGTFSLKRAAAYGVSVYREKSVRSGVTVSGFKPMRCLRKSNFSFQGFNFLIHKTGVTVLAQATSKAAVRNK